MPDMNGVCPLEELIKVIGGKWKVIILWRLQAGPQRFGQLRRQLSGVTQKMLTQQLRELEHDGFLTRTVFAEVPPRVEYAATPLAEKMGPLLQAMNEWSKANLPACSPAKGRRRRPGSAPAQPVLGRKSASPQ
jgi:DNA-binding HxlR family transcriptional regulator